MPLSWSILYFYGYQRQRMKYEPEIVTLAKSLLALRGGDAMFRGNIMRGFCHADPPAPRLGAEGKRGDAGGRLPSTPGASEVDGHGWAGHGGGALAGGLRRSPAGGGGRRSECGSLSGEAQCDICAGPRTDAGRRRDHLQQFLRIRLAQEYLARGPGAAATSLDSDHRRAGGKARHHRHRQSAEKDAARRTALPPPLCRGVGPWRCRGRASR